MEFIFQSWLYLHHKISQVSTSFFSFGRSKGEATVSKGSTSNGGKAKNSTSNATKSNAKSSSKSGNTLSVGPRRERSSSLANIYSRR